MKSSSKWITFLLVLVISITFSVVGLMSKYRSDESILDRVPTPLSMETVVPTPRSREEIKASFLNEEKRFVNAPKKTMMTEKPYLKGYVVIYSKDISFGKTDAEWVLNDDDEQLEFPIAETVEEVETVVLRTCQQQKGLDYKIKGTEKTIPSYYWRCELTIVDRTIPAVIHRKNFRSITENFSMLDSDIEKYETEIPNMEITEFLNGLPFK